MNGAWIKGSVWERALLKWKNPFSSPARQSLDIFAELRTAAKILILPNDRVGGLFIGAPVYKAIRQHYPETEINLVCDEHKAALARQISFIDEVIVANLYGSPVWSVAVRQLTRSLQSREYDLAFCLGADCSFRLLHVCGQSGARLRVGFRRKGLSDPFNVEIVRKNSRTYEGAQYQTMLDLLGLSACGEVEWAISQDRAQHVRRRYLDGEFEGGNVVAVDLARREGQGLNARQLEDIVGRVIERGARAVVFFSLAERKQVNYLKKTYGSRILAFDQDDLGGVAALLEGCRALISCNTDLLHLAISLRIPTVAIFDEDPQRWISPDNELVRVVQAKDVRAVSITQVVQALEQALKKHAVTLPVA